MIALLSLALAAAPAAGDTAVPQIMTATAPADLAFGKDIAAKLVPDGIYEKIMGGVMSKVMGSMGDQMTAMPLAPFLKATGMPPGEVAKLGQTTISQIMAIVDPAYRQRMQIMMSVMSEDLGKVMTQFEPDMRDGLAEAYATHFTSAQLADIDHFFNTPSGNAFASQTMLMTADPAVMQRMQAFLPKMMQAMPSLMEKAQAATASLPKPKTAKDLSPADRVKLAALMGVDPAKFNQAAKEPAQ